MPRQHISTRLCNAYLFHQTEAALQVKLGERVANCAQCTICLEFCCERVEDVILKNLPEAPARPISAKFGVFFACFGFRLSLLSFTSLCVPTVLYLLHVASCRLRISGVLSHHIKGDTDIRWANCSCKASIRLRWVLKAHTTRFVTPSPVAMQ